MSQNNLAIILSGGLGKRFDKKLPKQFFKINDKYILEISVQKIYTIKLICKNYSCDKFRISRPNKRSFKK